VSRQTQCPSAGLGWLDGAFEVEHTTAIYSGILRMADLLALQPNMQIRLHIVAPDERREKVLQEIKRPVVSLLDHGPLYERCTFMSYDAVQSISHEKHLTRMSDTILDEYEEHAVEGSCGGRPSPITESNRQAKSGELSSTASSATASNPIVRRTAKGAFQQTASTQNR
jgi:hypothetical protein